MLLRVVAVFLVVGLCLPRPALGAFDVSDTSWEGTSELFELAKKRLGRERLELTATLDYSKLTPKDGVVILHPESTLDYAELSAFLRAGGRVALLDDHGTGDKFLARFQINRVRAPLTPARTLRDNPSLPIAEPSVQIVAGQEQNRHPITQNVEGVVTNHPTALTHPNLTPVLTIAARGEPDATLAVTGIIVNRGRLFAMGDPSSFINLMLRYPGNRKFAEGLLSYLVEPDSWGERGGKLYFVSNRFQQRGEFGERGNMLSGLGQHLTDALDDLHEHGLPEPVPLALAAFGCLSIMAWGLLYAARPRPRTAPRYTAPEPLVAQGGVAGRIAVLSAPSTDPALGLSELRSAALEVLGERLSLGRGPSAKLVLAEIQRRNLLSDSELQDLTSALAELRVIDERILKKQRRLIPVARLDWLRKKLMAAVVEIEQRVGVG
ncbi:MAG: DUF4350 domain-containing protein [Myxococcales bacterium]|nr:MAG: DUF4350 domain-containing protein [Myxococcales bacterium]